MMPQLSTLILACTLLIAMPSHAENNLTFATEEAVSAWAERSNYGGYSVEAISYQQKKLLIVNRHFGSGLYNARPTVFLNTAKGWEVLFQSDKTYPHNFGYHIRDGFLEIFALDDKLPESIRINLALLP